MSTTHNDHTTNTTNTTGSTGSGLSTRTDRVVSWVGWHLGELSGVLVPAGVAVAVTPWAWIASGVVGLGWTVHEVRIAREQAAIRADRDLTPAQLAAGRRTDDTADDTTDDTTGPAVGAGAESDVAGPDVASDVASGWEGVR